jgi:alpha-tubulin suppressor-like RCC1 family protein
MSPTLRTKAGSFGTRSLGALPPALFVAVLLLASCAASAADRKPERPAGSEHTCAAVVGGGVRCWGANFSGQVGDGTNVNRNAPVGVWGLTGAVSVIAAGSEHTCAVAAGRVKCWGANASGQLGDGTNVNRNTPVDVVGLPANVIAIAAGSEHTCALTVGGAIWCWGANFSGQLGDGANVNRNAPVSVRGLASGTLVVAGSEHTCALTQGGAVACWGANASGQLGDASNVASKTPVGVPGLPTIRPSVRVRIL